MAKTLLLFSPIYSFVAESFVEKLLEVPENEDIEVWVNSPGGSVFAGWSIIAALNEMKGKKTAKVMGDASSMAFYALLFMDNVEAIDVINLTVHRADGYVETDEEKAYLAKINKDLRAKMEKRINQDLFKEVTGYSFDEIFDPEKRINVTIDAKAAKKIGLVDKIIRLEPKQIAALNEKMIGFVDYIAENVIDTEKKPIDNNIKINEKIKKTMTKAEIKTQFPLVYNEIIADERNRVQAILEFMDIDPVACKTQIDNGNEPNSKFFAEMTRKSMAANLVEKTKTETVVPVVTATEAKTTEQVEIDKAEIEAFEAAGIKMEGK
jgi:ATP-dependent Clp protease, protease subunit